MPEEQHVNVGIGEDVTIRELALEVARVVGVEAALRFDASKPDGTPRKLMDSRLLSMGWRPQTRLEEDCARPIPGFSKQSLGLRP